MASQLTNWPALGSLVLHMDAQAKGLILLK